jgi:two-component system sensor kinase
MKTLDQIKRFYVLLFAIIFILSQLFLHLFAIKYVERLLIRQRLDQNAQLVRLALEVVRSARLSSEKDETIQPVLQEIASKTFFDSESFVCFIDSGGTIVAHLDPQRVGLDRGDQQIQTESGPRPFAGEPELVEGIWENRGFSRTEIVSSLFNGELGLTIAAHQNKSVVDRNLRTMRFYFTLFSVMVLGVLFGLGWWLTRKTVSGYVNQVARYEADLEAFNYSVSHDLGAPLRAIDGFSDALLEDHADKLDAECNRLLTLIRTSAQKMAQLIDDLLTYSRVGRQETQVTEIDMAELARNATDNLGAGELERHVELEIGSLPAARGDRVLIGQVFANLISNSIKFTRSKDKPHIKIGYRAEGKETIYYVKDNGAGFDMRYVDKLFDVFQRLHSADAFEGTGVGLAIVESIIRKHGGRVWAEGKVGAGATIYFTLASGEIGK